MSNSKIISITMTPDPVEETLATAGAAAWTITATGGASLIPTETDTESEVPL